MKKIISIEDAIEIENMLLDSAKSLECAANRLSKLRGFDNSAVRMADVASALRTNSQPFREIINGVN